MKIALDVMGGDNAPDINVDGAKRALRDFPLIVTAWGFPVRAWRSFRLRKLWK